MADLLVADLEREKRTLSFTAHTGKRRGKKKGKRRDLEAAGGRKGRRNRLCGPSLWGTKKKGGRGANAAAEWRRGAWGGGKEMRTTAIKVFGEPEAKGKGGTSISPLCNPIGEKTPVVNLP